MRRLFIAAELPETVKDCIRSFQRPLNGMKWIDCAQYHITLRFIGDSDDKLFEQMKQALLKVEFTPFNVTLKDTGFFPNERRPAVFWLGIEESAPLVKLKEDIDIALTETGIEPEERKFSPHLTLLRIKKFPGKANIWKFGELFKGFEPQIFKINSFFLFSSVLKNSGAEHIKESEYISRIL